MLSKVLSGKDTERAQPVVFSFASVTQSEPPSKKAADDDECGALRAQKARYPRAAAAPAKSPIAASERARSANRSSRPPARQA